MRRFFVCLVVCIREGFAPERVARLGHGGFLMLEYQKSSAAAPKLRNKCWLGVFLAGVLALAFQQSKSNLCQPQSVGRGYGQVTISGTPA